MIVVANLRLAGFFRLAALWVLEHAHAPLTLLAGTVTVSGLLSAFFVNDTVCLVMTPLVLEVTLALRRNPVPYLLAVAMAANAGSAATITGNPQNMVIGSLSNIGYRPFAAALTPPALVALLLVFLILAWQYRAEFARTVRVDPEHVNVRVNRVLLAKSLVVSAGMIVFFFLGWPVAKVAIVAAGLLLITRRVKPEKVYREVDWSLLALFAGLFIVVAGMEKTGLPGQLFGWWNRFGLHHPVVLAGATAFLSNVVSNVPAVLVFRPLMAHVADPHLGWLTLAMASTLAGNLTIVGSVANLIVLERARGGAEISFWTYARSGIPVTLLSLAAGVAWLSLAYPAAGR
jgi:Na+/H+ antiporter NhaD/arsenite permease-like protein